MSPLAPTELEERTLELAGWPVRVRSHRLGDTYFAAVDNVDPGARIARGIGATREEAEAIALERAEERLAATRRHPPR